MIEVYSVRAGKGDVGACWDNALVERFFGSLKYDCIFKIHQPTREPMATDVAVYMRYYNLEMLHTKNGDQSPVNDEKSFINVSGRTWPEQYVNVCNINMLLHRLVVSEGATIPLTC